MGKSKQSNIIVIISALLVLGIFSQSQAAILYVNDDASGLNNGSSWANAYKFLQDALTAAVSGDQIKVAQGTYKPDAGGGKTLGNRTATFQLIDGVTIEGGYAGYGQADPNARDFDLYKSILSGDLSSNENPNSPSTALQWDNSLNIITGSSTDQTAILDGFTIISVVGRDAGSSVGQCILNRTGSPTIKNCTLLNYNTSNTFISLIYNYENSNAQFINCTFETMTSSTGSTIAAMLHGIIANSASNPRFEYCNFSKNVTGIVNSDSSKPVLNHCNFVNNNYGISNIESSNPSINNCTFEDNEKGIYNSSGSPTLTGCVFKNSTDTAITNNEGLITLYDCVFQGNYGPSGGAIAGGNLYLNNCIFTENSAAQNSYSAIANTEYSELHSCIFSGNTGGYLIKTTSGDILNCTFYGNNNKQSLINTNSSHTINLTGCIVWANTSSLSSKINVTYSDVQGGRTGPGNINIDPLFIAPGYWANPNNTSIVVDADYPNAVWIEGDYHLQSQAGRWDSQSQSWILDEVTSPCIDAGDPMAPIGLEPFPNGGINNMGAYGCTNQASKTYFGTKPCNIILPGDINGDCVVDYNDIQIVISHWLMKGEDFINQPPTITLIEPVDGAQIKWPGPTLFKAQAYDSDGQVVKVIFKREYKSEHEIAGSTSSSQQVNGIWQDQYSWEHFNNGPFGTWTAWAEATDNKGAKSLSQKIQITLVNP